METMPSTHEHGEILGQLRNFPTRVSNQFDWSKIFFDTNWKN